MSNPYLAKARQLIELWNCRTREKSLGGFVKAKLVPGISECTVADAVSLCNGVSPSLHATVIGVDRQRVTSPFSVDDMRLNRDT